MPKENDLEGAQDQGGKHGGQKGMPKTETRPHRGTDQGIAQIDTALAEARMAYAAAQPGFVRAGIDRRRGTRGQILERTACERATRSCFGRHFRSPVRRHIWLGYVAFRSGVVIAR